MSMTVMSPIVVENPFGAIMNTLANDVMPFVQALATNKEKIAQLSDAELNDYVPVLKQYAPDLLTQDGKIDWAKVNEYMTSDDPFKQKIANVLSTAKKYRGEYAKQPLIVKLNKMNEVATATDPTILKKIGASTQALQKLKNLITNSNLPDEVKYAFLLNADKFAEKPEYIELLDALLSGKKKQETAQQTTQQGGGATSWKFSLDGQKRFGIKLEEPKLTPPQVSPPQVPAVGEGSGAVKQKTTAGKGGGAVKQKTTGGQGKKVKTPPPNQNQQPFDPNYKPSEPPLQEAPFLDDLIGWGGTAAAGLLALLLGRAGLKKLASKIRTKVAEKGAQKASKKSDE